ncbi:MAG: galactokinase [Pseudomonadota bacterium]
MGQRSLKAEAAQLFGARFGAEPEVVDYAPGRVNLLGEHTDYNGGFVLPMPLPLGTAVALSPKGPSGHLAAASLAFDGVETRDLARLKEGGWTDYIVGSLSEVFGGALPETGFEIAVVADLPLGSGLSSSAALEVAVMRAVNRSFELDLSPVEIAKRAQRAENDYVGMPCGIMDQYSVSVGNPGTAVFLDTRALQSETVPLPASHKFVVIHSGVSHRLTGGSYGERVAECQAAAAALGVESLSDLGLIDLDRIAELTPPLNGRARHIVTENNRVHQAAAALRGGETGKFADLLVESHASQRDDYAVSVEEVDRLVEVALGAGADGARLTGGGFGGSVVAFVANEKVDAVTATISETLPETRILAVT